MKNLMTSILIASVFYSVGCKSETPPVKNTLTIETTTAAITPSEDSVKSQNTLISEKVVAEVSKIKKKELPEIAVEKTIDKSETPSLKKEIITSKPTVIEAPKNRIKKSEGSDSEIETTLKEKRILSPKPNHTSFDVLLKKHVSKSGKVNYKSFKLEHEKLKDYLQELASNLPTEDWSRDESLAYWINTYNAFTLDLILNNYPIKKITDLDGGNPWKVSRIKLGQKVFSLDEIENKIIRPKFNDPRIHFAVNCAAKSCPSLLNGAFFPENLDKQLESQTKAFVNNTLFNTISKDKILISKIFDWYAVDFGNLKEFLSRYSAVEISESAEIKYLEYDWSLNGN